MMVLTDKEAVHCVCKDPFVLHHGTPRRVAARRGASRRVAARRGTSRRVAARRGASRRVAARQGICRGDKQRYVYGFIVSHTEVCLRTWLCRLCASCHTSPWAEFAWGQALRLGVRPVNRIRSSRPVLAAASFGNSASGVEPTPGGGAHSFLCTRSVARARLSLRSPHRRTSRTSSGPSLWQVRGRHGLLWTGQPCGPKHNWLRCGDELVPSIPGSDVRHRTCTLRRP